MSNTKSNESIPGGTGMRYIDDKWICEDGLGGFLSYVNETWIKDNDECMREKWLKASSISENQSSNVCTIDGYTMRWCGEVQQWIPADEVNEDFLAIYHSNYGINHDYDAEKAGSLRNESAASKSESAEDAKRKCFSDSKKLAQGWFELDDSKNTGVYVSNLPSTIDAKSLQEVMSKCGVIQNDARTGKPKLKIYKYDDGTPKGDALCIYIKIESVNLALQILDGWKVDGQAISIQRAKFEMKGEYDAKKRKAKLTAAQKKRFMERQQKIFEWRPEKSRSYRPLSDCMIVMKNMFTLEQMMKDATLMCSIENEVRSACERFGTVKKITVHDNNPEGVVCVTFVNVEHSDAAVKYLNKRVIDGREILVTHWDGKTIFTVSEKEEQRKERLKHWHEFITNEND